MRSLKLLGEEVGNINKKKSELAAGVALTMQDVISGNKDKDYTVLIALVTEMGNSAPSLLDVLIQLKKYKPS